MFHQRHTVDLAAMEIVCKQTGVESSWEIPNALRLLSTAVGKHHYFHRRSADILLSEQCWHPPVLSGHTTFSLRRHYTQLDQETESQASLVFVMVMEYIQIELHRVRVL